ncbi:GtrA family protein [Fusibacter bizertensis]|uniref:GtrA family protein n=1 Tax=Fusibacter bizertensis TaxID=1488331 RepID=A0ABT6NFM9_9FIRM|nr:GtrA family protein [Fusibacter bizertensis]MDH8679236.1 GtrA family protein [Fusibacter bizertensis]
MNKLSSLLKSETASQLIKYLITGFTAFGIEYGLYVILYKWVGLYYIVASMIVYALVFWFSFFVNRIWSFKSTGNLKKQLMQYGLLFFFNLIVSNLFLMKFLTDVIGISALISPFLKAGFIVCWNFLIYKYIIYKK